jgi:predicted dehydrogenase
MSTSQNSILRTPGPATASIAPELNPQRAVRGLNRRNFLRHAVTTVIGGSVLPSIVPTGVLAAAQRPGPNDLITVGFIGVGRQGGDLFNFVGRMPGARILAAADVDWLRALQVAARIEGTMAYQDYREVLDRADIDAIVTATPEQWRGPICVEACQAGKDLYVEKPMSLTVREGRMIVQAVQRYQRVFQTGSQQRSMEPNRRGCELIRNGRFGKIQRIIAYNYPSPWECALPAEPQPTGLDWERWCGSAVRVPFHPDLYAPRANPGWLSFSPFSGGEMTGWGSHGFDQVQWALGMDDTGPVEVWTEGPPMAPPTYHKPESRERGDAICRQPKVFFRYPGDIIMELGDGPQGGAIFIGEHGRLRIDRAFCRSDPPELAEEPLENPAIPLPRSRNHVQDWLNAIRSRSKPIANEEVGHRTATVCHLGNIARRLGRRLRWDPVTERFENDAEANALLDRPRRKGYEIPWVG